MEHQGRLQHTAVRKVLTLPFRHSAPEFSNPSATAGVDGHRSVMVPVSQVVNTEHSERR